MDYETARSFLINQARLLNPNQDTFLSRLQQGKPPVPGQVTSILLALKVVFEALRAAPSLDRELIYTLHILALESRRQYDSQRKLGVVWPPLLDEDVTRISTAVKNIFSDEWKSA
ncbi:MULTISPECIES: Dethiobiotin synthetase [Trichocoleus]|uniref:Dethiobiotin synthetase n=1 Tax=Trichocoleus desertorum GB2-A4 TaxID=2933944 RepID=A0ABV0J3R4_9CYAN|nr:Dethiobiotin synthetase [Trichocoleus sp. FACHB-46]MBD1861766.1 Dethiobiotin synthetase [Trichocoleus sp. FACHB-46]